MSYDESDNIEYADYRINIIQYLNILLKYIYMVAYIIYIILVVAKYIV